MNAKVAEALRRSDARRAKLVRSLAPGGASSSPRATGERASEAVAHAMAPWPILLPLSAAAGLAAAVLLPLTAFESARLRPAVGPAVRGLGKGVVTLAKEVAFAQALSFAATVLRRVSAHPDG